MSTSLLTLLYFTSRAVYEFEWIGKLLVDDVNETPEEHYVDVVGARPFKPIYLRTRDP